MYEPIASPITWEGQVIGNWRLEKRLGEGGMSYVYLGHHQWLPQTGAVKVLRAELCQDEDAVERFRREALASSQLEHPNIVHIHDFGSDEGLGYFMVLELLDGADLEEHMSSAPFPKDWIYSLMEQVCSALAETHKAKIVHRDLKPSNIFLVPNEPYPRVKLLDFGIAKLPQVDKQLTQTGVLVGTPTSLAPEQLAQKGDLITPLVDVYATGVLLYQLLTGKLPIRHDNLSAQLMAIFEEIPPPLGAHRKELAGTALEALVAQMLAKSPQNRPASMKEAWRELSASLDAFKDPLSGDEVPTIEETSLSIRGLPTGMSITEEPSRVQHPAANRRRQRAGKGGRLPLPTVDDGVDEIIMQGRPSLPTGTPNRSTGPQLSPPSMPAVRPPSSASLTLYWMLITVFVIGMGGGIFYVFWQERKTQPPAPTPAATRVAPRRAITPQPKVRPRRSKPQSPTPQMAKARKALAIARQELKLFRGNAHMSDTKAQQQLLASWQQLIANDPMDLRQKGFPSTKKLAANLKHLQRFQAKQGKVIKLLYLGKHEEFQAQLTTFATDLTAAAPRFAPLLSPPEHKAWHKYLKRMRKRSVYLAKLLARAQQEHQQKSWRKAARLYDSYITKQPHAHNKAALQRQARRCKCALAPTSAHCKSPNK